jgi:hypothetical protein
LDGQGADQRHAENSQYCLSHVGLHSARAVEDNCIQLVCRPGE